VGWELPGGYVHANDEDLKQGRQALAKIHRIV
jgi:hypothetical protein